MPCITAFTDFKVNGAELEVGAFSALGAGMSGWVAGSDLVVFGASVGGTVCSVFGAVVDVAVVGPVDFGFDAVAVAGAFGVLVFVVTGFGACAFGAAEVVSTSVAVGSAGVVAAVSEGVVCVPLIAAESGCGAVTSEIGACAFDALLSETELHCASVNDTMQSTIPVATAVNEYFFIAFCFK